MRAIAELTKTHPIAYTGIHVEHDIQGKEEDRDETLATVQRHRMNCAA